MPRGERSTSARALRMVTLGAGVTGQYLRHWLAGPARGADGVGTVHTRVAQQIRQELSTLRGPIMKLGQTLSLQGALLPEEVLAELSKLHMEAPPMHPTLARLQFRRTIGVDPLDAFQSFEPIPFAAASIGQVHRAVSRRGDDLAVKIQYPGIALAIDQDFRLLRTASLAMRMTQHLPKSLLDELQAHIVREIDYRQEAHNLRAFKSGLAPLGFISVPDVIEEFSGERVLTMQRVVGEHLDTFLKRKPRQQLRDMVGTHLFQAFYFQLFTMRALHADPNWGNYLFRSDGTIGLVDFGCVKRFEADFVQNLKALFMFEGSRDSAAFHRLLRERYALSGSKLSTAARVAMVDLSEKFYQRVYPPDGTPFDFADDRPLQAYVKHAGMLLKAKGLLPEYLFLARAEMGLYNTLHRLRARVHTSNIVRLYLKT